MSEKLSERLERALRHAEAEDCPRLSSVLADSLNLARRWEEARRGTVVRVNFEDVRPVWAIMDDRHSVPLNEPRRVALVPLDAADGAEGAS